VAAHTGEAARAAGGFGQLEAWVGAVYGAVPRPEQVEVRRLGAAMRLVMERMVSTDAPASELAAAAAQVEALAERLSSFGHGGLYREFAEEPGVLERRGKAHPASFFDFAPLLGRSNPLAPPLSIEVVGDQVIGRARFGDAYEGPPGCVHGGYIAACFDDVLGLVQSALEEIAMTGTLSIRYLAPTPLHAEVRFVGWLVGRSGRKITTHGELRASGGAGEICTAEADGVFIIVDPEHFAQRWSANFDVPPT
jgi:acyl-coenzyme A thioesterase PaaI-like protein